ncbi:g11042 [Coccomyxa elongata]
MAALAMQRAVEQESEEPQWLKERDRLLLLIPDQPATILLEEGSKGLESWLAAEKERALPEFKRKRPKYYYYYEWMKERIGTHCGVLPAPVLDKLLNIEAGELDTLLTYPAGVQAKAEQLLDVLETHGPEYLETWRLPPLTWTELEELKANAGVPAIEASGTGKGKLLEGMTSLPIAAAAEDPEGVIFDDDDGDDEEDLDAVD